MSAQRFALTDMTMAGMAAAFAGVSTAALAAESGMSNWQLGFQASVSEVMDYISWFNNFTLIIITVITLFVLALLVICMLWPRNRKEAD